jgi:hypothetical protein
LRWVLGLTLEISINQYLFLKIFSLDLCKHCHCKFVDIQFNPFGDLTLTYVVSLHGRYGWHVSLKYHQTLHIWMCLVHVNMTKYWLMFRRYFISSYELWGDIVLRINMLSKFVWCICISKICSFTCTPWFQNFNINGHLVSSLRP